MAYFWVNQKQTWQHEYRGAYLWAPKIGAGGKPLHHWETMADIEPGDIIFSYVHGAIVATSAAKSRAYDSPRPAEFKGTKSKWKQNGRRVDVAYQELTKPVPLPAFVGVIQPLLPSRFSPIRSDAKGANEGYLYSLPPLAGRAILERLGIPEISTDDALQKAVEESVIASTERSALAKSRIGQGRFRDGVLAIWKNCCAVTSLDMAELLRASHIKPWRDSNNSERIDPYNGLCLSPSYDAAFDAGLITFTDDGMMLVAEELTDERLTQLGIHRNVRLTSPPHRSHCRYLDHHRSAVFRVR